MNKAFIAVAGLSLSLQVMAAGSVVINGKEIKSKDELHALMSTSLNFPKFYTKKMDSLYDVLSTDFQGTTKIRIKNSSILRSKLGAEYTDSLIQAIMTASDDNPKIILILE